MSTWIFQCSPDQFDLRGYLEADLPEIVWTVRQGAARMAIEDEVYLWRAVGSRPRGSGPPAGILAHARIIDTPRERSDHEESRRFWTNPSEVERVETRVSLAVDRVVNDRGVLRRDSLADDPVCRELTILRQPAATNFLVPPDQAARLRELWNRTGQDWSRAETLAALRVYAATYGLPISTRPGSPVAELAWTTGRLVASAYNKVLNFRALDPRDSRTGLSGASRIDRQVWNDYFDPMSGTIRVEALEAELNEGQRDGAPRPPAQPSSARDGAATGRRSLAEMMDAYRSRSRPRVPQRSVAAATSYDRDENVVELARARAGGNCEAPGCAYVPFETAAGTPFFEVHHLRRLADDGEDTLENVVCLCPIHHREIHNGRRAAELTEALRQLRARDGEEWR